MAPANSSSSRLDVWSVPSRGITWCDCGADHELTEEHVFNTLIDIGLNPAHMLTHSELVELTAEVWSYDEVCRFFHLALEESAQRIHGGIDERYPLREALSIVGYFSKTWQGCPEADCTSWDDEPGH